MFVAQTGMELRLLLRNGEQVVLALVIPLLLLFFFNLPLLYSLGGRRIDFVVPSILALAVMSSAFTGLAIGTGFERKYGVLKRLGATALPRSVLITGKTSAVLILEAVQIVLICGLGFALGLAAAGRSALAGPAHRHRHRRVRRPGVTRRRHAAGRGDVGGRQPHLAHPAVLRRDRHPVGQVPAGTAQTSCSSCPRPRCPTVCTLCCRTDRGHRSARW